MDRPAAVSRALRAAAPHALPGVLTAELTRLYGALGVQLLVADYSLTLLQPVAVLPHTEHPRSALTGAAGRAFSGQQPHGEPGPGPDTTRLHLPVTVRGDRIGVLAVDLPAADLPQPKGEEEPLPPAPAGTRETFATPTDRTCPTPADETRTTPADETRATPTDETCATPGDPTVAPTARVAELAQIAEILAHQIVVADRDTDLFLQARRAARLTLAAEIQWQLLPARSCARPEYTLGAQLQPAYAVHGDNFDWSTSADHLTLVATNGMGSGIDAALLTSLGVHALRNARRAGLDLVGQATLADQALYGQHRGECHLAALLIRFDLATGHAEVVDAGSPRLWLLREGTVDLVPFQAQLPLGMFEDTVYTTERFQALPGDRLLFVSDGVYDVPSKTGERYGERALARALHTTRLLPAAQVPRAVLEEVGGHRGHEDAEDDALVICLDWYGRPPTASTGATSEPAADGRPGPAGAPATGSPGTRPGS
ncbi:PP2C family protein-serine/threonine phosphatase [Streptomyces sp. NPDC059740]|uniref:PP2C family protein-serine/threonine phosphatase n=1 Tax=Streptomyces sp. NPDC059740 TaxID=3346926 RepID=UPI00364D31FB